MRSMTRELAHCDAELRKLTERLRDGWDPDEAANLREDIDQWLDRRIALSRGGTRSSHRASQMPQSP